MDHEAATRLQNLSRIVGIDRWIATAEISVDDIKRCTRSLITTIEEESQLDQFWARTVVRSFFVVVESMTFEMRLALREAYERGLANLTLSEAILLLDESFDLDNAGRPQSRPRFLAIDRNIRFVYPRFARLFDLTAELNVGANDWQNFVSGLKVRNRLTHPKSPEDLTLTAGEAVTVGRAMGWYLDTMTQLMEKIARQFDVAAAVLRRDDAVDQDSHSS